MKSDNAIQVLCLRCRHEGFVTGRVLVQLGLKSNEPIRAFVKRLRCSKCGSGSVMAKRIRSKGVAAAQRRSA
jgi:predicted nucleic-acid-binding Zn-ribbon protein